MPEVVLQLVVLLASSSVPEVESFTVEGDGTASATIIHLHCPNGLLNAFNKTWRLLL